MSDTILITGGAGFIGSHLAERLLDAGRRVVVLDSFDAFYDPALKRDNVRAAGGRSGYRLVEGDIRDGASVEALFAAERPATVVHLAARAGVRPSIADPVLYGSVNLEGTTRLLEACRRYGTRRFIFGSSSSVYGNNAKVPFAEDDPVDHPISPYAATKKAGELLCHVYHRLCGMDVACLRFFTVYGPRQRPEMAIRKFATLVAADQEIEQFGDGSSARDYTYVADIVDGIERAIDRVSGYRVWNLGGSRTVTLAELVAQIAGGLGRPARVRRLPLQPGDVERTWADITRARQELDWAPRIDLERGLRLFLDWFVQSGAGCGTGKPR
jgi:UDP-glucuronate 4-epimerase